VYSRRTDGDGDGVEERWPGMDVMAMRRGVSRGLRADTDIRHSISANLRFIFVGGQAVANACRAMFHTTGIISAWQTSLHLQWPQSHLLCLHVHTQVHLGILPSAATSPLRQSLCVTLTFLRNTSPTNQSLAGNPGPIAGNEIYFSSHAQCIP
jgi:hypothetical protein